MNLRTATCSLAISAAFVAITPLTAAAAPTVAFKTPTSGSTISGNIYQSSACEVTGSRIDRVRFYLDATALNTEENPPWNCNVDTTKFADGAHTLRAVAYDSRGASRSTQISVTIKNSTANTPPAVSFKAPLNGATVSGSLSSSACEAAASDSNGIKQVQFYMDGTALNTELSSPYQCSVDTLKFADGAHTLKAVATDGLGASSTAQIGITVKNSTSTTTSSTAPSVVWNAPAEGGTLTGNVQGPPNCVVTGTNIAKVMFYINGVWTNTDGNLDNGLGCWIDTTKYKDGAYTLKAVAYNAAGQASAPASRGIVIQNTTTTSSTAPSVVWSAPAEGGTLTGNVQGPPNCVVTGTNTAKVMFYINDVWTNTDGNLDNGLGCWIDTTKYKDGAYTLKAVAYNAAGQASVPASRGIVIKNTTSGTPGPVAIDAADIIGQALADVPFSQHAGYTGQVLGQYPTASSIPETGINGTVLSNGEAVRLGKQTDPTNSTRKALTFQLDPSDPVTSGSKRTEIAYGKNIEMEKTYWVAFKAFVYDWGTLNTGDAGLFGTQLHSGDNSAGYSPSFGIYTSGSRNFKIQVRGTGLSATLNYADQPLPFGRWVDFVFKVRQSTGSTGFLQAWMDGSQIVNHSGPIGYQTAYKDYFKFGYYNWSSAFNSSRKVLLRSPVIVLDPTGSKYDAAALRAFVNQ